jgi:hypothetical protein
MQVIVYPTSKNATNIKHPTDGPLRISGSEWTNDGFTARMLSDGAATLDSTAAYKQPAPGTPAPAAASSTAATGK